MLGASKKARRPSVAFGAAVGIVFALAGCGSGGITADTKCSDYLQFDGQSRHDAAIRISSELRSSNPGNPMWGLSLDAACGGSRDMTLGQYFSRSRR